jgi:hypothetical protein
MKHGSGRFEGVTYELKDANTLVVYEAIGRKDKEGAFSERATTFTREAK